MTVRRLFAFPGAALIVSGLAVLAGQTATPTQPEPIRWSRGKTEAVWTASGMERIGKFDAPGGNADVSLRAARGEYEAFQIIVRAGSRPVSSVRMEASALRGPGASIIPAAAFAFYREDYVYISKPSPDPGHGNRPLGKGWYPDALIPLNGSQSSALSGAAISSGFEVVANTNQPVWVDLRIPEKAVAGMYSAEIRVTGSGFDVRVPVRVRVWNFVLPLKPTLRSSFGMHEPGLSDRRLHELLLRHRIMPESVNPREAEELEQRFGLNITKLPFWGNFDGHTCTMDAPPSAADIKAALLPYPPNLQVYIYPADEIDRCPAVFGKVKSWSLNMHSADPRIKNLVTVSPDAALYDDGSGTGRSAVDIWTLLPKAYEASRDAVFKLQAKGDEIWSYTALVQDSYSPKWEIDFAPINYRIMPGFLSQSLGLTGILYWRVELWTSNPWQDVSGYHIDGNDYPGEGMLVYPGRPVSAEFAVPSMRLKWIREGIEDFEYVAILKRLGRGDWAIAVARQAGRDWKTWTYDPSVLDSARTQLGNEIERLWTEPGRADRRAPK